MWAPGAALIAGAGRLAKKNIFLRVANIAGESGMLKHLKMSRHKAYKVLNDFTLGPVMDATKPGSSNTRWLATDPGRLGK